MKDRVCKGCGSLIKKILAPDGTPIEEHPRLILICNTCGSISVLAEDMTHNLISQEHLNHLATNNPVLYSKVMQAVYLVSQRIRLN